MPSPITSSASTVIVPGPIVPCETWNFALSLVVPIPTFPLWLITTLLLMPKVEVPVTLKALAAFKLPVTFKLSLIITGKVPEAEISPSSLIKRDLVLVPPAPTPILKFVAT